MMLSMNNHLLEPKLVRIVFVCLVICYIKEGDLLYHRKMAKHKMLANNTVYIMLKCLGLDYMCEFHLQSNWWELTMRLTVYSV